MQEQHSFQIGHLLGDFAHRIKAIEEWQQRWEARAYRASILIGLWLLALLSNASPSQIAEVAAATIKLLLTGS